MHGFELYDPSNRWRDRHSAEKALFAGGLLLLAVTLPPGVASIWILTVVTSAAVGGAGVPWRRFVRGMLIPTGFLAVGALSVLVTVKFSPGDVWPTVGYDFPGAARVALRGLSGTACLILFATTTSIPDLLSLLRSVRCPECAVELMMLTYRFLLGLVQTARGVRTAQRLRLGYASRAMGFRSLALLAGSLLPRCLDRAERLTRGLEARGYDGHLTVLSPARSISRASVGAILAVDLATAGFGFLPGGAI